MGKGILGAICIIGGVIIQGIGTILTIADNTEKTLQNYIESEEEEES